MPFVSLILLQQLLLLAIGGVPLYYFLPTRYRSISIEVLAAIGERIRRDVENTHNRGAISEFNSRRGSVHVYR